MTDLSFTPLVALGALVFAFTNFLKFFMNRDWNAAFTQAVVWAAGCIGMILFAHTDFAGGITVNGTAHLDKINTWSLVFLGLMASSLLTTVNEIKKALDRTDSAVTPHLFRRYGPTTTHRRWRLRSPFWSVEPITEDASAKTAA